MKIRILSTATFALPAAALALVAALTPGISEGESQAIAAGRGLAVTKAPTAQEISAKYTRVRARMGSLYAQGSSEAAVAETIRNEFGLVPVSGGSARAKGLVPVATQGNVDVTMSKPTMMYDSETHYYVISARYAWKNNCSALGTNTPCWAKDKKTNGDIGGADGFAIKVYPHRISLRDQGMSTYNNCGTPQYQVSQPNSRSAYGVGFYLQDRVGDGSGASCKGTTKRMNMDSGVITAAFVFEGNCTSAPTNVDSYLAHSWDTTSLNGIGISLGKDSVGFSASWATTGHQWTVLPQYAFNGSC